MLFAVAATLLHASPSFAIAVSRRVDVKPDVVAKVTSAIEEALAEERFPNVMTTSEARLRMLQHGVEDSASCDNDRVCLIGLMHLLRVDVLIAVDVGHVVDQYALRITALEAEQGAPLAERGGLLKVRSFNATLSEDVRAFTISLAKAIEGRTWASPVPELAPRPVDAPVVLVTPAPAPTPWQRPAMIGALVAGGVGLAASVIFEVMGVSQKSRLDGSIMGDHSTLSRPDAEALASSANAWFTTGLVTALIGVAAVALGALFGLTS